MTAYQIVGPLVNVPVDTTATLSLSADTNNFAGNKNITVLKVDNTSLTDVAGIGFSLSGTVSTYDANNVTGIAPGGTVFVQVANSNYTGSVYVRASGADVYVQAVAV
jgi:hypothetical protein